MINSSFEGKIIAFSILFENKITDEQLISQILGTNFEKKVENSIPKENPATQVKKQI